MKTSETPDAAPAFDANALTEARALARGAEVLPDGINALAQRIQLARTENRPLRVKLGVDPTGSDLHLGHTVVLRRLRLFQDHGHQAVLLIGGLTAQIGDPTGRNQARPPLTADEVARNAETFVAQVSGILDTSRLELRNNADWFSAMTLPAVLQMAARVTVNQLTAKDSFGQRLEQGLPVGLHELFYPLLQGMDSVMINADVEIGGTDQRFNILQGRHMQSQLGALPQIGLLLPLLEGTDGKKKMSKSANNWIGLQDEAEAAFAKCMRLPDSLILKFFQLATLLPAEELDALESSLAAGSNPRDAKLRLAHQIVREMHGNAAADKARAAWERVHTHGLVPETMPAHELSAETALFKLMVTLGVAESGNKARQLITSGAVRLDGEKVTEAQAMLVPQHAPEGTVLQVGKRHFIRLQPGASVVTRQ